MSIEKSDPFSEKKQSNLLLLKAPSGKKLLPTSQTLPPPLKTRERDCRPSECCHQAQGKILSFRLEKQKKKDGGEKSSSSKNAEVFVFSER